MSHYVAITYRNGRPFAAYYYLARRVGDRVVRTIEAEGGLVIDYTDNERPIGIEIASPAEFSLESLNRVLDALGMEQASRDDVAPLLAA